LATGQITVTDTPLVERREREDFSSVDLDHLAAMASMIDPRRFGATANAVARLMATAITTLA
jgi:hypothetical protein